MLYHQSLLKQIFLMSVHLHSVGKRRFYSNLMNIVNYHNLNNFNLDTLDENKINHHNNLIKQKNILRPVYTTEKIGSGPVKKVVRTQNFCKEVLEFPQGHRRLWPCGNSSISLLKFWVRTTFLTGPDPNFSVV